MSTPTQKAPSQLPEARAQPITASSSEEQNFHRQFPKVPQNEKLVEWCQCGLSRKMLVRMGKLYLTSLRLCFQSSFLDDIIMIPWEGISSVDKKSSFMFDAIVVTNKSTGDELSFTAFLGGGISQIFKLMRTLWTVRERYAVSEAASLSRSGASPVANEESSSSLDGDEVGDGDSSGDTDMSDFTEGVIGRRASQSMGDDLSSISGRHDHPTTPKQPRVPGEFSRLNDNNHPDSPSPINLANDPITGDAKRKKQTLPAPASPTTTVKQSNNTAANALTLEVRSLFSKLPQEETVTDSFQCSCVSGVHRLGKMFITQHFILFASVMMEENLQIAFEDVDSIEKEQTMMILDGISVRLKNVKRAISFTSFVSRDAVFNTLVFFFSAVKRERETEAGEVEGVANDGPLEFRTATSQYDLSKIPVATSLEEFSKVGTDWGTALSDYACFTKEIIKPVELPAGRGVLEVFRLCFDDRTKVLDTYHAKRSDSAQTWEDWRATTDGQGFRGQRRYTCTTLVKAMMGKACPYTEYQRYAFLNVGGTAPTLLVQFSSQISGVMFSDAFRAEALVTFTQTGTDDAASVTMRAYGYVQFLRSVWVKGKIQSKTLDDELPASYNALAKMIVEVLKAGGGAAGVGETGGATPTDEAVEAVARSMAAVPAAATGGNPLPTLQPQTRMAQKMMSHVSVGLAALVLLCALRGVFSTFVATLPHDGVMCSVVRGFPDHDDSEENAKGNGGGKGLLSFSDSCSAAVSEGRRMGSCAPGTDGLVLHYLRPPLLAFQLLVLLVFAGALVRVASQV